MANATDVLIPLMELQQLQQDILQRNNQRRLKVASPSQGLHPSFFTGQGVELHDLHPYQHGDDPRHIDWRATARRGTPMSKRYIAERNRSLCLIVDRRDNMRFGSQHEIKMATAVRCAAMLAFSAIASGERVGGITLENNSLQHFTAVRDHNRLFDFINTINQMPPDHQTHNSNPDYGSINIQAALNHVAQHLASGTDIVIISDLYEWQDDARPQSHILKPDQHKHAIMIRDQAEYQLPNAGRLRLQTPGTDHSYTINSSDPQLRDRFAKQVALQQTQIKQFCAQHHIHLTRIDSQQALHHQLGGLL